VQKSTVALHPWRGRVRQHCDGVSGRPSEGRPGWACLKSCHHKSCCDSDLRLTGPSGLQIRPCFRDPPAPPGLRYLPRTPRADRSTQVVDKSVARVRSSSFPGSSEAQAHTTFPGRAGPSSGHKPPPYRIKRILPTSGTIGKPGSSGRRNPDGQYTNIALPIRLYRGTVPR